jgi:hypothetical protein
MGATTLSIMAFKITIFSITALIIKDLYVTLSTTTFIITTFSTNGL